MSRSALTAVTETVDANLLVREPGCRKCRRMRKEVRISQDRQMKGDDSFASSLAIGESFM